MSTALCDITIIGAGPAGLFALFYAGMRGVSAQVVDALPEPGGQLTALYPEKYIFDVAGFPKILTKELVRALVEQALQFGGRIHCNERVLSLDESADGFVLVTDGQRLPTRAIVVAAGIGAFAPRKLPQACAAPWYDRGIYDRVVDPAAFAGKRVVIIGGGDTAFDWAHQLRDRAARVTLVHRSDRFRAHAATVAEVEAAAARGEIGLHTFHELAEVLVVDGTLTGLQLKDIKAKSIRTIDADVVLPMLGFVSDIGPLAEWGLTVEQDEIVVNSQMETGRAGVWAAGDITTYPGKLKLIATGFAEAATAVNQAVHHIYPEKKVNPGHSSNLAIFGQKDD